MSCVFFFFSRARLGRYLFARAAYKSCARDDTIWNACPPRVTFVAAAPVTLTPTAVAPYPSHLLWVYCDISSLSACLYYSACRPYHGSACSPRCSIRREVYTSILHVYNRCTSMTDFKRSCRRFLPFCTCWWSIRSPREYARSLRRRFCLTETYVYRTGRGVVTVILKSSRPIFFFLGVGSSSST